MVALGKWLILLVPPSAAAKTVKTALHFSGTNLFFSHHAKFIASSSPRENPESTTKNGHWCCSSAAGWSSEKGEE
jgi:hypothetical protein